MANVKRSHGFVAEQVLTGTAIPIWTGLNGSNCIISKGCPVCATLGYVYHREGVSGDKAILGVAVHNAVAASTGTRTTAVYFVPAVDWVVFSGQCSGNFTQGVIWQVRDIEYQSDANSGKEEINENAGSNDELLIIGKKDNSAFGTYGEALFIFAKSKFTGKVTSLAI